MNRINLILTAIVISAVLTAGCSIAGWINIPSVSEPIQGVSNGNLEISGDFPVSGYLPLMDELQSTLKDIQTLLCLPAMSESTHIRVFSNSYSLEKAIKQKSRVLPFRRTYFFEDVKNHRMEILVKYTDYIADDLRHECTHAYLHSICPKLPLWLDEGLAEYFEPPRTVQGYQPRHINRLMLRSNTSNWKPNLTRLDDLEKSIQYDLTIEQYAESWIWVHFLLNYSPESKQVLVDYLQALNFQQNPPALSKQLLELYPDCEQRVHDYLLDMNHRLAEEAELSDELKGSDNLKEKNSK